MDINEVQEMKLKYARVFKNEDGEGVLEDLKRRFYFNTTTFSQDPHEIAYNEGQRAVVLFLDHMLKDQNEMNKVYIQQSQQNEESINE